jgi:nucleotide-binding universal stress UspA family protein
MVLTDFTAAAGVAASHCYQLAALTQAEVLSLHVVSNGDDKTWAEEKSAEQIRSVAGYNSSIPFTPLATMQDLFRGMNSFLQSHAVDMAFMATHGKKDLQFLTGSHALKVIFSAEVPTLVVQQHTPVQPYRHILVPVFSHQAGMRIPMELLQIIVRSFGSRITLLRSTASSSTEEEGTQQTVDQVTAALQDAAARIDVKSSGQPEKMLGKEVLSAAQKDRADLIAVPLGAKHHRDEAEKMKKFYQALITNAQGVPVLCL